MLSKEIFCGSIMERFVELESFEGFEGFLEGWADDGWGLSDIYFGVLRVICDKIMGFFFMFKYL